MRFVKFAFLVVCVAACAPPKPLAVAYDPDVTPAPPPVEPRAILAEAAQRYSDVAAQRDPASGYPRATNEQGRWLATPMNEWTSGFFPGTLWYLYAHSGDARLREHAERWTWPLFMIPRGNYSHDLGFQFNSSFVNAYRFTGDARFRGPALTAARLLAARFNPNVGAIKSWDWMPANKPFPVIVDNMMNLELLFWAARQPEGDPTWKQIAITHARTTITNHIRPDGGSYHVVVFDPNNGAVLQRITHQGYADSTTWARGQAWLIYGFTMAYRESGEVEFLRTAQRVADYFIRHTRSDLPCWDFQAPNCPDGAKRDVSAAAIAASALLELSDYVGADGARYRAAARTLLSILSSDQYRLPASRSESLLQHAVGNMPASTEIDVGLAYADYYYTEAMLRLLGARPGFTPHTITARGELLREARERVAKNDRAATNVLRQLLHEADSTLQLPPFTVTAKTRVPPSGDKRDYMSFGPYWWPDPTKPNGLPYIRRDGEVNWELRRESDALRLYAFTDAVETLALAYYFTGEPKYAERATALIRTWFFDPQTRMNPHLRYAQAIPGVTEGRGIGIIDTRDLGRVTDATALLATSAAWRPSDEAGLRAWMRAYLDWLKNSEHGRDEAEEANNHGTWYDVQIASLALYLGDSATARAALTQSVPARLRAQIDTSGRQPLELARTRSLHYSVENLDAMTRLAEFSRHIGVDLWHSQSDAGVKLRKAIEFVAPYADTAKRWTAGQQITAERDDQFVPVLARAYVALGEPRYLQLLAKTGVWNAHRMQLLYPPPARFAPDTLLSISRITQLPPGERDAWQRYIATSDSNRARDRAAIDAELRATGKTTWTPAPAGSGFFAEAALERTPANTTAARQLALNLVTYQTPTGGWSKRIAFTRARQPAESFASEDNWSWIGTLDNGGTTEQLQFIAAVLRHADDNVLRNSFARGVEYLLSAQFPNGCWPQVYPLQGSYHDAATFNDDATVNALRVLRSVARGEVGGLPQELRARANAAVTRGVQCIVNSQVVIAGKRTVWGAQHDPLTLVPVKARAYEHASLSGRESAAIVDFLMQTENPGAEVINAIHSAVDWFNATAIRGYTYVPRGELMAAPHGGPLWARFYELGTNRPIFSDRDGIVRYSLSEVGEERRRGYLWYTDEPITTLRRYERWAARHPQPRSNR